MKSIPLKPANELFTDEQWQSIFDGGDNLLISASAGSGKTTVLVRRVIEKLKAGSNIDQLLIVTYTEAAAREMKERIQVALREAVNQESNEERRQHFTKQLILLPTANISTLHAFCLTVIRRFYYLIDLDPVFRMLTDETETILLKEDVWDELREGFYAANNETFFQLAGNFSNDRNDNGLTDLVFSLYEFARANPDPQKWLDQLVDNYELSDGLASSKLFKEQMLPLMREIVAVELDNYEQMAHWAQAEEGLVKVIDLVSVEQQQLTAFHQALMANDLDQAYDALTALDFSGRYPSIRKAELKEAAQEIKKYRDAAKIAIQGIKDNYFPCAPADMIARMECAAPLVKEMAKIGTSFMEAYYQRKLEKGLLDFNDLEHFTLQILQYQNEDGVREASDYYRNKFEEVLVDEYQDVNRLQEAILYWLREPDETKGNLFMVGDVKQSIYSFRLADPTLFIEKYNAFKEENGGRRIILAENFRSRHEVLDFTNLVFEQLMDEEVGQIPYDDAAKLVAGFPNFPESEAFHTEILLYEKDSDMEEDAYVEDKTDGELQVTGLKIRELIDQGFLIYDKKLKENRPLTFSDIVLLTPTKKNNIAILETFKKFDIPIEVNDAQNYFQASEIRTMISLLQIIDNPYQDIPLAAVLRSPVVDLNENELAQVRVSNKAGSFYEAMVAYNKPDALGKKLQVFCNQLNSWREQARRRPIAELLGEIYDETAYPEYVLGLPAGKQRHANLLALVDRAKNYERTSFRGLYQFVRFIEKMQEKDKDLAEPLAATQEDAVRVMTIHASKGLEFPVVFVLDMTKQFNLQDTKARYMFEEQAGVGIRYLNPENRVLQDTLPYLAIRQLKLKKLLSEEMRKLYVALTRAEQKLFLVGSYKNQEELFKHWGQGQEATMVLPAPLRLKGHSSLMDWIGMTLVRHPDMTTFWPEAETAGFLREHGARFSIQWLKESELAEQVTQLQLSTVSESREIKESLPNDWQVRAQTILNYQYPFTVATMTTSYQSVSEIKRLFEDPDEAGTGKLVWQSNQERAVSQHRYAQEELGRPNFMSVVKTPTAATIGTATHTILQLVPMDQEPTKEIIEEVILELIGANNLEPAIAKRINIDNILAFFQTDLGQFLLAHEKLLKREQPFAMLMPAEDIFADFPETDDKLLIHGIIDGYVKLDDQIVLYDFKTNRFRDPGDEKEIEKVTENYLGQLRLYAQALSKAEGLPVTKVILVFLEYGLLVDLSERI